MKDFLKNNGLWILFAGAVIAVALALLSYFSTNSSPLVNLANTVTAPFRAVSASVSGWFADKQNYYADNKSLKEENEALKQQIAEMEAGRGRQPGKCLSPGPAGPAPAAPRPQRL